MSDLLERRYRYVTKRREYIEPVTQAAIPDLYERYNGNLRGFLRLLSAAVQRYPFAGSVRPLSMQDVIQSVATEYRRALAKHLSPADVEYIAKTIARTGSPRFRNADVVEATPLSVPGAREFIERLLAGRAVVLDQTRGRSTYYRLVGDALTAFAM